MEEHFLTRPRMAALLGVFGLIFAVGLALMFAQDRFLFVLGAVLCYVSVFLTWTLYREDLKRTIGVVRHWKHLALLPREIVFVATVMVVATIIPTYLIALKLLPSAEKQSLLATESLPGFSATVALQIHDVAALRRKYLFEYATPEGAHASFYLSAKDHPTFSVTDTEGEPHPLEVPLGNDGIPISKTIYLTCEIGVSDNTTSMRVFVDGKEVARQELSFAVDLGSKKWARGTIGADLAHQNNGSFQMGFFGVGHVTMRNKNLEAHIENVRKLVETLGFQPDVGEQPPKKEPISPPKNPKPPKTEASKPIREGQGGAGGNAKTTGNNSHALAGPGGGGGMYGQGGRGGNAEAHGDNSVAQGGEGGQAGQADGTGGRGGRSPAELLGLPNTQLSDGTHLYDYGRGGNGANAITPRAELGSPAGRPKDQSGNSMGRSMETAGSSRKAK